MKRIFTFLSICSFCLCGFGQTAIQIGSASNAYSTYLSGEHCLWLHTQTGTNGGSLSFVHRENTAIHTGGSSGKIRYGISTNGGTTWTTEKGTITPLNTFLSRYPAGVLFNPDTASTDINDLKLALVCPTLNATPAFEGHVMGLVDSAATANFSVLQEDYLYRAPNAKTRIPRSLVERVPGEFFYVCFANNVRDIDVYRGRYSSSLQEVTWTLLTTISPTYRVGAQQPQGLQCAFDPSGTTGYISFVGDLAGGKDSVYSPCFIKTTNGGVTWGTPEEINMSDYGSLRDSLTVGPLSSGIATTGSSYPAGSNVIPNCTDLIVDGNGTPHFVVLVGNTQSPTSLYTMGNSKYMVVDFTQDINGAWIGKYVASKVTRRGILGNAGIVSGSLNIETWMQVTRNQSGDKIFYSWTETDPTRPNWTPLLDNDAPNLLGRAYDLTTDLMTPVVNWTIGDTAWSGRVLTPIVANSVIESTGSASVPTMAMRMQTNTTSALLPVSYWYFPNITYFNTAYTDSTVCFLTCASTPLATGFMITDEICDGANGAVTANVTSTTQNPGPYTYNWASGQTTQTITGLLAGSYEVTITDNNGCATTDTVVITNTPGPVLDSASVLDATCFNGTNGAASVTITGGTAPYRYAWITGDTTASISNVGAGGYLIQVTDVNGCTLDTMVAIGQPLDISILTNSTMPSCFGIADGTAGTAVTGGNPGYTYLWSNGDTASTATGLVAGAYTVTVMDANGCTKAAMVTVNNPVDIMITTTSFDVSCNGGSDGTAAVSVTGGQSPYFYTWSNGTVTQGLSNVPAGTYTITITDMNSCMKTDSVTITQPDPLTATPMITGVSCNGAMDGSVNLDVMGGTAPYTYNWTSGDNTKDVSGLGGGTVAVTITDSKGCSGNAIAMVPEPSALNANVFVTPDNGTGNGTATSNTTGGTAPYSYMWNGNAGSATLANLFAGNYILEITDANGCTVTDTIVVGSNVGIEDLQKAGFANIMVYPNPTQGNFYINVSLVRSAELKVTIYDIHGRVVLEENLPTSRAHIFESSLNGKPSGTYLLKLSTSEGEVYKRIIIE